MQLYLIRRRSAWATIDDLKVSGAKSASIGDNEMPDRVRWIRSYVVEEPDGRIGTSCVYQARDEASILDHAGRVGIPADDIVPVLDTALIRSDPQ